MCSTNAKEIKNSHQKQKIIWGIFHYPPIHFAKKPLRKMGVGDQVLKIYIDQLKEYEHTVIRNITVPRILAYMKNSKHIVCMPSVPNAPGQMPNTITSNSVHIVPSAGIVIRKESRSDFSKQGAVVSLEKILKNKNLKGLFVKEGSYGKKANKLLKKYEDSKNINADVNTDISRYFKMLSRNRMDYFIDYPFSYNSHLMNMSKIEERSQFMFLPIQEENNPNFAVTICNEGELSSKFLEKVNVVLMHPKNKKLIKSKVHEFLPVGVSIK